ncbi:probable ubiquitin-specific processing protease 21 [Serendipita indica DSM 11827]|uniref:ubiquitinyl hydrolase 1 n=1 Tax=Serendipita indica (strain DSM 11827) TaxID=1109443 RepID=G4U2K1_SERID|nr:probable ubiquitin-specific processing protease 21 [Serendipita indica DSM 11827]
MTESNDEPMSGPATQQPEETLTISVDDHETFMQRHLPDLGQEVEDTQVFSWPLSNWKKLDRKITSPEFPCGGHKWRVLLFPFGNASAPPNDSMSIYLDYVPPKNSENWHACAQFALVLSNPSDPTNFVVSHAHHRFVPEECDWGFTRFYDLRKLFQAPDPARHPIIENESAIVTVFVRVLKDPTGVLWHNFVNYDSKKETGYVGLKNQGATCYMNSLLQSLYCTRYFRKAVYQIPTENDIASESVALALQRVFYGLQTSDQPVGTNELTKSFGWKSLDSFMQHDVQEFNRVLQDKLESKMKGTAAEGAINRLFVGKMKSYIRCVNVDFESSRTEEFYDIQLNVKGMRNLRESFQDYVAVETLEGDNKYQAEGHGLQDAKKGVIFQSFPPVLHLQLKRFEYDIQRDAMVKINDRHEFPFEIDLEEFLDETADRSEPHVYKLHGVLVHSGDLHGGHYFALIKPDRETRWLKYDDDRVTPVTDKEVLEDNYGGESTTGLLQHQRQQVRTLKRFTNAYMLVYIRESKLDEVLGPLAEADTPVHLRKMIEEEQRQAERKKRERDEQHLYLTVKIITDQSFQQHQGFDLATFEDKNWPASEVPTFRVLKQETFVKFKARVAQSVNIPPDRIRLWVLVGRQNKTVRPDVPVPDHDASMTMEMVRNTMAVRSAELRLFLDIRSEVEKVHPEPNGNTLMIFLKYFDAAKQQLYGVGKIYVQRQMRVGDLSGIVCEKMRWPSSTPLRFFEEIKPGMIELMKTKATFAQSEIQDGDIICFQVELSDKDVLDLESQGLSASPVSFYDFLQNRIIIHFRPKDEQSIEEGFDLTLSKKMTYDMMSQKVGDYLKHDHLKLRFTTTQSNGQPKQVLKRALNQAVSEIIQPTYLAHQTPTILYELLDVPISELETKRSLKIVWTGLHNKEEGAFPFLLPKTYTVAELADQVIKNVTLSPTGTGRIRLFGISKDGKRQEELSGGEMIGNLSDAAELYAEEIPVEEAQADEADKVIFAYHFYREPTRAHGVPFRCVCKPNETFAETKKRLAARLQVPERDWAKYRFALIQEATFKQPTYINDEDCLYDHKFLSDDVLGLDHMDKSGKRTNGAYKNEALVIKG